MIATASMRRPHSAASSCSRFGWAWAPFVLAGLLAGPCTAAYAALEEAVGPVQAALIEGPREVHDHGHAHHSGHRHVHEHDGGSTTQDPTTIDDGCCFGVKAATAASGKPLPEPKAPSHIALAPAAASFGWLPPPATRSAVRVIDRSRLHQTSPPVYLTTLRIRD